MKEFFYTVLCFLGILVGLTACSKSNQLITISKSLDFFNSVELTEGFELLFTEDSLSRIEIFGYSNQLEKVDFNIEQGVLFIRNKDKSRWRHPKKNKIVIHLFAPEINRIKADDGCKVITNAITSKEFGLILRGRACEADITLNCGTFYYWNNFPCGGTMKLSGNSEILKLWNVGLMSVDASLLKTDYAEIENTSKGDCIVNVIERLSYKIGGSGNIQLSGNPLVIELDKSGSGKLIRY
ncbi:MAG: DUF2807 domain-containing protein [Bacteroidetes bacterium]|nr:DUF2807 domain-containing protein [Bacteroidota bacterium]